MELDTSSWSGEGDFTQTLIDFFGNLDKVTFVRVEDARSSRSDVEYNFISNEVYVRFRTCDRQIRSRVLGIFPVARVVPAPASSLTELEHALSGCQEIGPPDYADTSMLQ